MIRRYEEQTRDAVYIGTAEDESVQLQIRTHLQKVLSLYYIQQTHRHDGDVVNVHTCLCLLINFKILHGHPRDWPKVTIIWR